MDDLTFSISKSQTWEASILGFISESIVHLNLSEIKCQEIMVSYGIFEEEG